MAPAPLAPWICIPGGPTEPPSRRHAEIMHTIVMLSSLPSSSAFCGLANMPLPCRHLSTDPHPLLSESRCGLNTWSLAPTAHWLILAFKVRHICTFCQILLSVHMCPLPFWPQPILRPSQIRQLWGTPPRLHLIPLVPNLETKMLPPRRRACTLHLENFMLSRPYSYLL